MRGIRTGATVGLSLHMALFLILRAPLPAQAPAAAAIEIASSPAGAFVYLNGRILGKSPLVAEGLAPGVYEIEFQKPGYVPKTVTVNAAGGSRYVVSVELEELTGFLELSVEPEGAEILVDGASVPPGLMKLRAGAHKVEARLFGYETQERAVFVSTLFPQRASFALVPAPFRLSGLLASRSPFSPENQGLLGTTRIAFAVSAPGSARLAVKDSLGEEVASKDFGSFDTWDQSFDWDGRNADGSILPDGDYEAVLESTVPGGEPISLTTPIRIDSAARIRVRSLATGSSGFLFSPDASVLPKNGIEMRMGALFPIRFDSSQTIVPLWPGLRMGLGSGFELSVIFPIAIGLAGSSVSASLKYQYSKRRAPIGFEGAALVLGSVGALPGDPPLESAGTRGAVALRLPFGFAAGILDASLSPSVSGVFGPAGFHARTGASAALGIQAAAIDVHLSANADLDLPGFSLRWPLRVGLDARYLIPPLPFSIEAGAAASIGPDGSLYPSALAGIGIIY